MPAHDVFLREHRTFTRRSPFGGNKKSIQIGGSLYDVFQRCNSGLRNHESFHPVRDGGALAPLDEVYNIQHPIKHNPRSTPSVPGSFAPVVRPFQGLKKPHAHAARPAPAAKKRLSSILNGGSISPLE